MRILAIETSCDETAVAIVENGTKVLTNMIATSRDAFAKTGGVIPEEAARKQLECMLPMLHQALKEAGCTKDDIDAIAVTKGPGLMGSLLIGTVTARTLASIWGKPLIGIHHTMGHLSSTWLDTTEDDQPQFPVLSLSASGGHTELWYRTAHTQGHLLGRTRDDAAGEAFDKGASLMGLPYPGGPSMAKSAESGDDSAFDFPIPLKKEKTLDFSYSGLKTALKYAMRDHPDAKTEDLAASFQKAINVQLLDRFQAALEQYPDAKEVHLVGGVSANQHLRKICAVLPIKLRAPTQIRYCTDNAAMIASAAYFLATEKPETLGEKFETGASIPLTEALSA